MTTTTTFLFRTFAGAAVLLVLAGCQTADLPGAGDPGAAFGGPPAGGACACDPEPVGDPAWGGNAGDYAGGMAGAEDR